MPNTSGSELLKGLNPQQLEAVKCIEGPLLVLAGAGTGKTRVITARIAYMISRGIDPGSILGVTFTNKAAKEMRERIEKLVSPDAAKSVTLGTFHSFCARALRADIRFAGNYNSSYSIADESDQSGIVRQAAAELGYSKDEVSTPEVVSYIGHCKNKMWAPEDALENSAQNHPGENLLAQIYERYQQLLELQNTVDFDDLLLLTVRILEKHPEVLERYRRKYRYLLVDEYQDTNAAQFRLIQLLAGDTMNLCVVGDDDQSIYAWRGADVANILDFPRYFPGAVQIKLEQNYRSTNNILSTANAVIAPNAARYAKKLWSAKDSGEPIQIVRLKNGDDEAKFVVDRIMDMCAEGLYRYSDFAILYRSNHLSRALEMAFREVRIRPRIIGGQEFFQRKEVKDAAAYLKLILNPRDDQSLLRIISLPPRGIGDKAIETLRSMRQATGIPLSELLGSPEFHAKLSKAAVAGAKNLYEAMAKAREAFARPGDLFLKTQDYLYGVGYMDGLQRIYRDLKEAETRRDNVLEFMSYMGQFEQNQDHPVDLPEFLEKYSLLDDNDRTKEEDEDRDAPILTTVHASKGLEFPVVFVVGMEQNLFPHERALAEGGQDEERRLFYVAVTRAREQLYLTSARERFRYREYVRSLPSMFLNDVPQELSERSEGGGKFYRELTEDEQAAAFADIMRKLQDAAYE